MTGKLMDFYDASRIVAGTEKKARFRGGSLLTLNPFEKPFTDKGAYIDFTAEEREEKSWSVEPGKIIVYGVCDDDGTSRLYEDFPKNGGDGKWWVSGRQGAMLNRDNLFPKDKPQKYRLVPADQPSGIPWFSPLSYSKTD